MISIAIKHARDPRRARFVDAIVGRYPHAIVVEDRGLGVWDTARRAWEAATGDHHVVVDDDVTLPGNFDDVLAENVADRVLALCDPWPGASLCMPRSWIPEFLGWCAENVREDYHYDDARVHLWAHRTEREVRRLALVTHHWLGRVQPRPRLDLERVWDRARKVAL